MILEQKFDNTLIKEGEPPGKPKKRGGKPVERAMHLSPLQPTLGFTPILALPHKGEQ